MGLDVRLLDAQSDIQTLFPPTVKLTSFNEYTGYLNRDGGWAHAQQGIVRLAEKVKSMGGQIIIEHTVKRLIRKDNKTTGVECVNGAVFNASIVIIATGAWSAATFPELQLQDMFLATGLVFSSLAIFSVNNYEIVNASPQSNLPRRRRKPTAAIPSY